MKFKSIIMKHFLVISFLSLITVSLLAQDNEPCLLIQGDKNLDCKYITEFIKFSGQAKFANIYFSTIHTDDKKEILGL